MSEEDDFVDLFVNAKVDLLSARYHRAMDALRRYGQHDKNCGVNIRWWGVHDGKTSRGTGGCTCGLKDALEAK